MTTETDAPEVEAPAEEATEEATEVSSARTPRMGMQALLTRDTDMAARPGFRNPSNKRSKAQSTSGTRKTKREYPKRKKGKKKR